MRSSHSGLFSGVLGWGSGFGLGALGVILGVFLVHQCVLCRYGDTLGGIRGWALGWPDWFSGWMHCLCWGLFVCAGTGFHRSRVWQICFWCSLMFVGLLVGGDCFQRVLAFFCVDGVAVPGLVWALWGVFLVHCVLCCAGDSDCAWN